MAEQTNPIPFLLSAVIKMSAYNIKSMKWIKDVLFLRDSMPGKITLSLND